MFTCKRCDTETRDGVTCSLCEGRFDFPCAGITEAGWRKLGDRKATWKCGSCKALAAASPRTNTLKASSTDADTILSELKRLTTQMEALPILVSSVKAIQQELSELKMIKAEFADMKSSIEFVHGSIETLSNRVSSLEEELDSMKKTKQEMSILREQVDKLESLHRETEQRSRLNNIEIKGVPMSNSENLFTIITKIGDVIGCHITKDQINYVARIPMRNDKNHKNIICSVHNSYLKSDFVAAARKHKLLKVGELGLPGENRVYINDHLTLDNKILLNKTKARAKERGFEHVWVKGCKIFIRKKHTSPMHHIKTEHDLKKFLF
ncbi:unnamed protein product [Arctia plantaginis]|uniref:FP protein C-terminal domain-containing protein n=1 Tax=Arctia plantaginis TaxID=874455 RepID=A0A8S1BMI4_ARCPL|nr:unnamed protein product [Arctia plantaginis]